MIIGEYIDTYFPTIDGVIMTVHNYATFLNDKQNTCYVATAKDKNGFIDDRPYEIIRYSSLPIPRRSGYRTGIPILDLEFVMQEHSLEPDIVHAHSPFAAGMEAMRVARSRNIPLVATFHSKFYDDFLKATGSERIAEMAVDLVVLFFENADYVFTVNNATAQTLRDYGFKKELTIMPNGTDYAAPKDIPAAIRKINETYNIDPDDKVILFVGQQIEQKNISSTINASEIYAKKNPKIKLMLVGEGQDKKRFEREAAESSIADKIIFTGKISDRSLLDGIYTRADVFSFPSIYDNAPLVVREAAAAKTPSVLIAGSNAADGTTDGYNAYHCENTPESIAAAIERALSDDRKRAEIAQNACDTISMSWEKIAGSVKTAYADIIKDYSATHKTEKHRESFFALPKRF